MTEERESEGAGYFRYGNSARPFDKIQTYALARFALFVAKRHRQPRSYGWLMVAYESPNRMGLINLNGRVVAHGRTGRGGRSRTPTAKDVGEPCEGEPHARFDGGREETNASRLTPRGVRRLPPTRP